MDDNFSPRVKNVITYSKEEALRLGHDFIGTEHLILGIIRDGNGKAMHIMNNLDVDFNYLRKKVEVLSPANAAGYQNNDKKNLHLTRQAERAIKTTFLEAKLYNTSLVSTAHLLLCILRNENDPTTKLMKKLKIDYEIVKENYIAMINNEEENKDDFPRAESYNDDSMNDDSLRDNPYNNPTSVNRSNKKSKTP
ncbi:MAG TPA: Clp protease ClpC, partial [Flavobacterium sp.]|nr:Clp protease ClpC [Flavobacterium sp.]